MSIEVRFGGLAINHGPAGGATLFGPPKHNREGKEKRMCNICADEKYDFIKCLNCEAEACTDCYKTFFATSLNLPACMTPGCNRAFDAAQLAPALGKGATKTMFDERRRDRLIKADDMHTADTQEYVIPRVRVMEDMFKELATMYAKYLEILRDGTGGPATVRQNIAALENRIAAAYDDLKDQPMARIINGPVAAAAAGPSAPAEARRAKRYMPCSMPDCQGLFELSRGDCMMCSKAHCVRCLEPVEDLATHTCDPDTLSTAKVKLSSTKPCPQCRALIQKSYGCDQMMCTACNTVFSWSTGEVDRGAVHNPYYYHLTAEQRRQVDEARARCAANPAGNCFNATLGNMQNRFNAAIESMRRTHRELVLQAEDAYAYASHLARRSLPDDINARDELQNLNARDFEREGRIDRVQALLHHRLPPEVNPRKSEQEKFRMANDYVTSPPPFTAKDRSAGLLRRDTLHNKALAAATARVAFLELFTDLVRTMVVDEVSRAAALEAIAAAWAAFKETEEKNTTGKNSLNGYRRGRV